MWNKSIRSEHGYVPVYLEDIDRSVLVSQLLLDLLKGVHFSTCRRLVHFALTGPQSPLVVVHILLCEAACL